MYAPDFALLNTELLRLLRISSILFFVKELPINAAADTLFTGVDVVSISCLLIKFI